MTLNKIGNVRKDSGFTIVELLIVIVVIAILATISIVAYSGIQTRAKTTKAQANGVQVQKVAEAYYADKGVYPTVAAHFNTGNTYANLPAAVVLPTNATATTASSITSANGENTVGYRFTSGATGACALYYNFTTPGVNFLYMGDATSANCSATLGSILAP
jgi:prepilin-type N-terminal cleavage/methylation domain-containing protein